ncbi:MAG TPA: hypothetical protein PLH57_12345, partial [Oligoflexia bacterium]|nr:hypothetical protein [Oligoflexia bacterium]
NILEGTVKLGFAGDANPMDLKIMGKDCRVSAAGSGSSVNISVDPTNSKKQVSITGDGKIQLEADGKKSLIDPGKIAAVGENKKIEIEEEVFKQSLPRNNARLVIGESTQIGDGRGNLPFEWSRRKTEVGTIEIDGAEHLQVPIQAEDTKTKVPLRSGDYRWRLISRSQKSGSPWFDFSALVVDRPSIRYPAPQTAFRIPHTEDEKEIQLVFSHPNPDFEVETQLYAVGKSGELVLKREDSLQPGARTGQQEVLELELEVGQYQLRARSVYTTKGQNRKVYSPWTQPTTFAIIREPAPTPVPTPRPTPIARKPASEDMNSDSHLKKPAIRPRNGSTIDEP